MTRSYPRLKALVMLNRSASSLDLTELLSVAEDAFPPTHTAEAIDWSERFAMPLITELRRRLITASQERDYKPELIVTLRKMRAAQKDKKKTGVWRGKLDELEAAVDRLIAEETQPSLFKEDASCGS
jgi:hypothetical protein